MYKHGVRTRPTYQQQSCAIQQLMAIAFIFLLTSCQVNIHNQEQESTTATAMQETTNIANIGVDAMTTAQSKPRLILIHGLHQSSFIMKPLAKKLTTAGYDVYSFSYPTLSQTLPEHSEKLNAWLTEHHDITQPLHMVGHSLGGLVIRDFISRYPQWQVDKVVNLGTPNLGSVSADYTKKIAPFMVGKAYKNGLDGNVADVPASVTLGIIAGNKSVGVGTPFLMYNNRFNNTFNNELNNNSNNEQNTGTKRQNTEDQDNDGTVYIFETRLPSASDHIVLPVTHTGMLTNKAVARETIHFLQNGTFTE